jgi:hypothetical protein
MSNLQTKFEFMTEGLRRRDEGCEQVLENNPDFFEEAYQIGQHLADTRDEFTVDDIHALCGSVPVHHNAWGAVIKQLKEDQIIRTIDYRKSIRPEAHARVISVYGPYHRRQ